MKKKFMMMFLICAMVFSIAGGVQGQENDIVDTAIEADDFETLVAAVVEAELVEALKGDGPFTVFAPTDEAFAELLTALDVTAEELLAREDLADILLYHVAAGNVMSTDLEDGMEIETLQGQNVVISLNSVMVNDANVVTADIEASNGVIHVIDGVLIPVDEETHNNPQTSSTSVVPYVLMALLIAVAGIYFALRGRRTTAS